MLQICRAEDGKLFEVNASLWDVERTGSLELFVQQATGIEQDAVIAYLPNGQRLKSDNVRELAGAQDNMIYVYNKFYLDDDLEEVLKELHAEPPLQPSIEDTSVATPPLRPSQLAAEYLHTGIIHQNAIDNTLSSIRRQYEALRIASQTLDLNILAIADAFEIFSTNASRELDRQASLLNGLNADMEAVRQTDIHPEFMSTAVRRQIEAGEKSRTLGSYVSELKMRQVADGCLKLHNEFSEKFSQSKAVMDRLTVGGDQVREVLTNTRSLEMGDVCHRRTQEAIDKLTDIVGLLEKPSPHSDGLVIECQQLDLALRREVEIITDLKNSAIELCVNALRKISTLTPDIVQLPSNMAALQADLRGKTTFSHVQRLHNMTYAYGATIIEIVRRKEFSRFFYQRAQSILEVMSRLSAGERKRRQIYRSEVHGQLPFETKGMDGQVPTIDFSSSGGSETEYSLERADIDAFLNLLNNIEQKLSSNPDSIRSTREALFKLISRMDSLESTFERTVERSLLSASRLSVSRRRSIEADEATIQHLTDELKSLQTTKNDQETALTEQCHTLKFELASLRDESQRIASALEEERVHTERLESDIAMARAQGDSESKARRILEQRHSDLLREVENLKKAHAQALQDATEQTKVAQSVKQEWMQAQRELVEYKAMESKNSEKITSMLEDQMTTLRNLEDARSRGEDLESQIQSARLENEETNLALRNAREQQDRLLQAQAMEHDRIIRDHIAEADGDRAVLEHHCLEIKAQLEDSQRQVQELQVAIEVLRTENANLHEGFQRVDHNLKEARHVERVLRDDLSAGMSSRSNFERRLDDGDRLIAQLLDVAIAFRNSNVKALQSLQAMATHPGSTSRVGNQVDTLTSPEPRSPGPNPNPIDEPSPIDPTDPVTALEALRSFNHDLFAECVSKVGSVLRKWQKQCKEYRERAKGKITFRNFAKGDLALFLPTRNSISKPWAAFNVSFPHYFLKATGRLADSLKTREWIVARITSLNERVVDHRDPDSNPYGLGEGVKYYMLEVEDWTQPGNSTKRKGSALKKTSDQVSISPPDRPISPPPTVEPESDVSAAESLGATRSPTSHLFPVRKRANSLTAGPSSLSRLLAQASPSPESTNEGDGAPAERPRSPSPSLSPRRPSSSTRQAALGHSPNVSSPLRPGSRASTASRFSVTGGRIPPFPTSSSSGSSGNAKAAATIALSSEVPMAPATSRTASFITAENDQRTQPDVSNGSRERATPSPTNSATEGLSSVISARRRTTSEIIPTLALRATGAAAASTSATTATSALASLANWGAVIGRRKNTMSSKAGSPTPTEGNRTASDANRSTNSSRTRASELLRKL